MTDDALRLMSGHVLWEIRQLARLASEIQVRRAAGHVEFAAPVDAAILEAWAVHARNVIDFLWGRRDRRAAISARKTDVIAADYFEEGPWLDHRVLPVEVALARQRVHQTVAHLTCHRLETEVVGWDDVSITHQLGYWSSRFAADVSESKTVNGFRDLVFSEVVAWRGVLPLEVVPQPTIPVATPAHPSMWKQLDRERGLDS